MGGLARACRDVVDVHVEGARRGRVETEAAEAALLEGLPQRHLLARRLPGVAVAARLKPTVELAVVQQEDARAVGRGGDRAARQVALEDASIERLHVAKDEGEDPVAVACLLVVRRHVAPQRVDEGLGRPRLAGVTGRQLPVVARTLLDSAHARAHGEARGARRPRGARPALPRRSLRGRRPRLRVALDALVRPHLRRHDLGRGDGARRLHGRAGPRERPRRAPPGGAAAARLRPRGAPGRRHRPPHPAPPAGPALGLRPPRRSTGLTGALEHLGIAVLAALVLLPPTVLLGATVPLAVEFLVRAGTDVHAGFGRLYLLNTLGGALGVALAPFVLVPALGVRGTLVAAAAASLFVGGVARRWSLESGRSRPRREAGGGRAHSRSPTPSGGRARPLSRLRVGSRHLRRRGPVDPVVRARHRLVGLRLQRHAARRAPRHRVGVGGLREDAGPCRPSGAGRGPPLPRGGPLRSRRPVGDRPPSDRVPRRALRAARLVRRAAGRRPRPLPRHDAAGDAGPRPHLPAAPPPRRSRRRGRAEGVGPPLRLEHGRGHRRGARRRPAAREAPRPPAAVPRVRGAPAGRGGVGPGRRRRVAAPRAGHRAASGRPPPRERSSPSGSRGTRCS